MTDLTDVIEDAVNDSQAPAPEVEDTGSVEATPEPESTAIETPAAAAEEVPPVESADAPVTEEEPVQDEFDKKFGVTATSVTGRENRIPYSRVKKITEKAVSEIAEVALGRKLNPGEKAVDVVKAHVARLPELETKVTEYEGRLDKIGEFENIMATQPQRFLQMLEKVPAYQSFFQFVREAYNAQQTGQAAPAPQEQVAATDVDEPMPEPNEALPDGTKVYNMEGLKALMAWNARQTEKRVNKTWEGKYTELEKRYQPIESEWQHRRRVESVLPQIRAQIAEAKTWPKFNEYEAEITAALDADQNLSLEGAYRKVVLPKILEEKNTVRQNVIQELKTAPRATAVGGNKATPKPVESTGPRNLTDVIKQAVETLK